MNKTLCVGRIVNPLEPILLLILAGVVLFVVIALILPVLKMSGTI